MYVKYYDIPVIKNKIAKCIKCLLYARNYSKCFAYIDSFIP